MSSNGNGGQMTVHNLLERYKDQIAAALPKHLSADRMARLALTETRRNKQLAKADPVSLLGAVVQASQLGLEIGPGGAWLVPFGQEVQCIPDYRGLIKLARQSGEIGRLSAHVVRDGDFFDYEFGLEERLSHRPGPNPEGEVLYAYAVAAAKDGSWAQFDVMTREEIDAVRKRSKASSNGPWVTDFAAMACKTVIKRLCKLLPQSSQLTSALRLDDDAEIGRQNMRSVLDEDAALEPEPPAIEAPRRRSEAQSPVEGEEVNAEFVEDTEKLASAKQVEALRKAADREGVPVGELCEAMEVDDLDDLPAAKVNDALDWLAGATAA